MILSAESTTSFQSSASAEESRRRLLDALSRGLPAAGEILRRRRNVEENTDWEEIQRSRQEEVVQDMRKRLASMPEPTSSPTISSSSKSVAPLQATKTDSSSSEIGSSPCSSRIAARLQFLDALEKGFRDFQTPLKNTASNASLASDGAGVKDNLQSPMEAASEVLGPDFFASVNALQERMALRKSNSLASQAQLSPDVPISLQRRSEVSSSSQEAPDCCSRSNVSCDCGQSCERTHGDNTLIVDAESHSTNKGDSGDEGFQSNTEELLRWAEEVLQKAKNENEMDARSGIADEHIPNLPAGRGNSRPVHVRGQSERQQRAETWKDEVNRLNQESEEELERLASEASRRQQHVQDDGWRHRITSAAEEMRSNISRWRFDLEEQTAKDSRRATSLPRPQRPCAPPSAPSVPSAPRNFRKALYTKNAQLASTEVRWVQLEAELEAGGSRPIHFTDIPWPEGSTSLTDVEPGDDAIVAKRKLAHALRRWHPDKWRRILDRVPESEHSLVMERVKSIAQRLLEEKAKLSEFGGVFR